MSVFSDCFAKIKKCRGLTASQIAQICGRDKKEIFQWLAGTELPKDWQRIKVMSQRIQLSLDEEKELRSAYQRSQMGEETYICYVKVMEFFAILQQKSEKSPTIRQKCIWKRQEITLPDMVRMNSRLEIFQWVQNMFDYLAVHKEKRLYLKVQTLHREFLMLLKIFLDRTENCKIEEIVYFENEENISQIHNLEVLKGVGEILIQKHPIEIFWLEEINCEKGFSDNWILSDDFLILFDDQLTEGIIVTEIEWLRYFYITFQKLKDCSWRLGGKAHCLSDKFYEYEKEGITINYLEYMPYNIWNYKARKGCSIFFREGLIEFMETGYMESFCTDDCESLKLDTRCKMVQRAAALMEQGKMFCYMVKKKESLDMRGVCLEYITEPEKSLYIEMKFGKENKGWLIIQNKGIYQQFEYFFEYLKNSEYVYSVQETAEYMKKIAVKYKKKLEK